MSDTNRDPLGMMTPAQVARLAELRTKAACCNAEAAQFWQALANGWDAAWDALSLTVATLQRSAIGLLREMAELPRKEATDGN